MLVVGSFKTALHLIEQLHRVIIATAVFSDSLSLLLETSAGPAGPWRGAAASVPSPLASERRVRTAFHFQIRKTISLTINAVLCSVNVLCACC